MGKEVPAEAVNDMIANFVLPRSKNMPGSDEYFDQVVFVELNRSESQRYLDEMKRKLSSPHSLEDSVYSHNLPPQQTQGASTVSMGLGQSSCSPHPPSGYNYQIFNQMYSTSRPEAGPIGSVPSFVEAYHGNTNPLLHRAAASFEVGSSYENSLSRNASSYYGPGVGRQLPHYSYPLSDQLPHYSYPLSDPCRTPNYEGRSPIRGATAEPHRANMIEPSLAGSTRMTSFDYNSSSSGHVSGTDRSDLHAPRGFTPFRSAFPPMYGPLYGTPPGPTYGNFPSSMPYPGGHVPGPGYY